MALFFKIVINSLTHSLRYTVIIFDSRVNLIKQGCQRNSRAWLILYA